MLIVRTLPYSLVDIVQILAIRAAVEGLALEDDALAALGALGERTSLRYAAQALTPARIVAQSKGRETITVADVEDVEGLFKDAKSSAKMLAEQADKYLS